MATLELKLDKSLFSKAVYRTQGVVDKRNTTNMLAHVLIQAKAQDMQCRLIGTDHDVSMIADFKCQVIQEGEACINGKSLFSIVKDLHGNEVSLKTLSNDWAEIQAGRAQFKLAGVSPIDFPDIEIPEDLKWLSFPKSALNELFDKTSFSVSNDETRMSLNGVYFKIDEGSEEGVSLLTMVSTDGHRLSKVELETEIGGWTKGDAYAGIIHKKGVAEVKRLFDMDSDVIQVAFSEGTICFRAEDEAGSTLFLVRQIEESYPDYTRVIPSNPPIKMVLDREELFHAIRSISKVTSSKTSIIKFEVQANKLALTASSPDYGEGQVVLDVNYDGPGKVIGFNYTYLLDVLSNIKGQSVSFEMTDEFSPTMMTSPSEPGAIFVVMPMRI